MKLVVMCVLLLAGCPGSEKGAPCARHSDCVSGVCGRDGHCTVAEAVDAEIDASSSIPSIDADVEPIDAAVDAP